MVSQIVHEFFDFWYARVDEQHRFDFLNLDELKDEDVVHRASFDEFGVVDDDIVALVVHHGSELGVVEFLLGLVSWCFFDPLNCQRSLL